MKQHQQQQQDARQDALAAQAKEATEFADSDQLLRHDARQTPVPPSIAARLRESIARLPAPEAPWWRRWFKK